MSLILETANVRVEYGAFIALPDFTLNLAGGSLLGLIGPNGAGKTTCLKAMAGLLPLAAGSVRVLGEPVVPGNVAAQSRIGFAPDTPPLYEAMSVADFLRFIGKSYYLDGELVEERIDFWLEQLWLSDRRSAKIKTLSRGMRQRLTVARTLLPDPALVLLDEPAAGLDPAGRVQFRKMLSSLREQGRAMVVSSHILADLHEYCSHIAIMEAGRIRQFGTVAQIVGGKEENRCRYDLTLARPFPGAAEVLAEIPGLTHAETNGRHLSFEFEHDDTAASKVLAKLIQAGMEVSRFAPVEHDLEQAYLRTGIRQVD